MCDQKTACIDIETTGLTWPDRVLSLGVSYRNGDGSIHSQAWSVTAQDLFHPQTPIPQIRSELIPILQQADIVIGHNITFDLSYLFKHGIILPDEIKGKLFDTLLVGRMTAPHDSHSLAALCAEYKIGTPEWRAKKGKRGKLDREPVDSLLAYNVEDTNYNLLLGEHLWDLGKTIYDPAFMVRESEFCRIMAEVRVQGMPLDPIKTFTRLNQLRQQKQNLLMTYLWNNKIEGAYDSAGLVRFLKQQGVTTFKYTEKGNISLDEKAVQALIDQLLTPHPLTKDENGDVIEEALYYDPKTTRLKRDLPPRIEGIVNVLDAVLASRGWEKEANTWLDPFLTKHGYEDGMVHASYTVGGTKSYRLSCSEPNLQAIPDLDIWGPHIVMDYSQAEYRLAALFTGYMTGDYSLAEGYANGLDAHTVTASILFGVKEPTKDQRRVGKTINFASNYGAGAERVAYQLGIPVAAAKQFLDLYRQKLASTFRTSRQVNQAWMDRGYVKLWTGKRIWRKSDDPDYVGWNRLIQGGVAEIVKEAQMELDRRSTPMWGQVHDSIKYPPTVDVEECYDAMYNALPEDIRNWTTPAINMLVDSEYKGIKKEEVTQ